MKLAKCFSCVLLISFVNYAECVMCAVCPRYSLHKSNAMLKHCGGSPKRLEAQSLQGTLHDGLAMPLFFVLFSFGNEFVHVA